MTWIVGNWKNILMAALLSLVAAFGYLWRYEVKAFDKFRVEVAAAAKAQEEKTALVTKTQSTATTQVEAQYVQGSDAVRSIYGAGRVQPDSGSRKLSRVPKAATKPDAATADARPDPAVSQASEVDQCAALRSDAAVTTRQLLFLQDWITRQEAIK